jgi:hypothetical protein
MAIAAPTISRDIEGKLPMKKDHHAIARHHETIRTTQPHNRSADVVHGRPKHMTERSKEDWNNFNAVAGKGAKTKAGHRTRTETSHD